MFTLGKNSLDKLVGVKPALVSVVKRAIEITSQDFSVLEGVRTPERQAELYAQGRDPAHPGPIVTWTKTSRHFNGNAVDLVPHPVDWETPSKFDAISQAMFAAAAELGVAIRWGADWDRDGKPREKGESDSPHFELA